MNKPETPKRRRWFQFRLRTLLIATLVLSFPLSWFGARLRKATRQREVVRIIEDAGGRVGYAFTLVPRWTRELFGDDFFADVDWVSLTGEFGDDEAVCLEELADLSRLILDDTQVTDAGLEHLEGATELYELSLNNTQVTDANLKHLRGLTSLGSLSLDNTQVTDAGLEHLKWLTDLKWLSLNNTQVTDAGLQHLRGLPNLMSLSLDNTQVTDAGLEYLDGRDLWILSLNNTQVTAAGLERFRRLVWLYVINTQVTPEGVKKLQEALPDCDIDY